MSNILDEILAVKVEQVKAARLLRSENDLWHEAVARQDLRGFEAAIEGNIAQGKPAVDWPRSKKPRHPKVFYVRTSTPRRSRLPMLRAAPLVYRF